MTTVAIQKFLVLPKITVGFAAVMSDSISP